MNFGWKSPFPRRFGGGTENPVDSFYRSMQNARPTVLRSASAQSDVDTENQIAARILAIGWNETARRVAQADPTKLGLDQRPVVYPGNAREVISPLERWERIFVIRPADTASPAERRAAVAARAKGVVATTRSAVLDACKAIFGSWLQTFTENSVKDVDYSGKSPAGSVQAEWGTSTTTFSADYPGHYDASWPWTTGLAVVTAHILPPASVPQADVTLAVEKCLTALDDLLPAWMSATVSQWGPGQTQPGFIVGTSEVGLTAL